MRAWRLAWFGSSETPSLEKMPMVPGMGGGHGGPRRQRDHGHGR
jgi:hypothetical protein